MPWREMMHNLAQALREGQIPEPEREAQYLLQWATGRTYADWIAWGGGIADDAVQRAYTALGRRLAREPLAYITGHQEFYGLDLVVNPGVLIPRPETEVLVQVVLDVVRHSDVIAVDVGCGSGAIALALQSMRPAWTIYGADISIPALQLAACNGERLRLAVQWLHSDLLLEVPTPVDVIVANLPYVDPADKAHMSPETLYEPPLALFAKDRGLGLISRLIGLSADWLSDSGQIFLECSPVQSNSVSNALEHSGFHEVSIVRDYAGLDRVVFATRA